MSSLISRLIDGRLIANMPAVGRLSFKLVHHDV
jgi:hypothetical protein